MRKRLCCRLRDSSVFFVENLRMTLVRRYAKQTDEQCSPRQGRRIVRRCVSPCVILSGANVPVARCEVERAKTCNKLLVLASKMRQHFGISQGAAKLLYNSVRNNGQSRTPVPTGWDTTVSYGGTPNKQAATQGRPFRLCRKSASVIHYPLCGYSP